VWKRCDVICSLDVDWSNGDGLEEALGCVERTASSSGTYRRAGLDRTLLVTQAEAAVQEDVPVVSLEQEEQRREASLQGRAALTHRHLATVARTLVLDEVVSHGVVRVGRVGGVAVLQNDCKAISLYILNGHAHKQRGAQGQVDWACWVRL